MGPTSQHSALLQQACGPQDRLTSVLKGCGYECPPSQNATTAKCCPGLGERNATPLLACTAVKHRRFSTTSERCVFYCPTSVLRPTSSVLRPPSSVLPLSSSPQLITRNFCPCSRGLGGMSCSFFVSRGHLIPSPAALGEFCFPSPSLFLSSPPAHSSS